MAKLSAATVKALDVIAHCAMASNLEKNVAGMQGFREFYDNQLPPSEKAVIDQFDRLCKSAYRDLARLIAEDGNGTPT